MGQFLGRITHVAGIHRAIDHEFLADRVVDKIIDVVVPAGINGLLDGRLDFMVDFSFHDAVSVEKGLFVHFTVPHACGEGVRFFVPETVA